MFLFSLKKLSVLNDFDTKAIPRSYYLNYLFAKKNNGHFILRTEDTDFARNQEKFVKSQYEEIC